MSQPNPQPAASADNKLWIYLAYIFVNFFGLLGLVGLAVVKDDDHVRFHCAQAFALGLPCAVVFILLSWIPIVNILGWLLDVAVFVYALYVMIKAANGEHFKIPVVGDFAEKNLMNLFK
jgi:uncharacterized membrane protein